MKQAPVENDNQQSGQEGNERRGVHPAFALLGLFALVLSFILPPGRMEFSICSFYNVTGLPCPGCGLTRSIVYLSHLNFEKAFRSNPMGFPIYLVLLFLALYNFIPPAPRKRLDGFLKRYHRHYILLGVLVLAGMLATWIFRLIVVYDHHMPYLDRL